MNRPVSPLLHDYKPSATLQVRKSTAFHWFALGLGLPFIGLALHLLLKNASGTSSVPDNRDPSDPLPELAIELPIIVGNLGDDLVAIDLSHIARKPEIESQYELITVTVHSGDTMERIFRQNKLNLGHLASIAKLKDAGKYIRILRPGDRFEIRHDQGQVISIYRELNLTSSLVVSKNESGFKSKIIDRPIEIRRRLAYGRIETSLFESAIEAGMPDKLTMNLAGIFAWDIDFVFDIRTGDD